jgi:protein TonB
MNPITRISKRSMNILGSAFAVAVAVNLALLLLISYLISHRPSKIETVTKPQPVHFLDLPLRALPQQAEIKKSADTSSEPTPELEPRKPGPIKTAKKSSPDRPARPRKMPDKKARPESKPLKNKTPSQAVPAPRIEVPEHGTGSELASVPGSDSRLTAPPGQWSLDKTPDADTAKGDENGEGGAGSRKLIVLSRVLPTYPRHAKARRIEGWVRVDISVTPSGRVSGVQVDDSNPKGVFDQAALEAVRQWRFQPAYKGGRPVAQRAFLIVKFRLVDH